MTHQLSLPGPAFVEIEHKNTCQCASDEYRYLEFDQRQPCNCDFGKRLRDHLERNGLIAKV